MKSYEIVEMAILTGGYDLKAMAKKIDTLYANDSLTEDEWQKLRKLCCDKLKPEDTRPELPSMYRKACGFKASKKAS